MYPKLLKSMYGPRDAASNWEAEYTTTLKKLGFTVGKAVSCIFSHASKDLCLVIHGDDFTILGYEGCEVAAAPD